MKILISACLLGLPCRYDGTSKPQLWVEELAGYDLVAESLTNRSRWAVCPPREIRRNGGETGW